MKITGQKSTPNSILLLPHLRRTTAFWKLMNIFSRWEGTISHPGVAVLLTIREIYNPSGLPFLPWHTLTILNWAPWALWNMGRLQVTQRLFIPYIPILLCLCVMGNLTYLLQICIYPVYTCNDLIICNIYRLFLGA